jgi:hypothetical protein
VKREPARSSGRLQKTLTPPTARIAGALGWGAVGGIAIGSLALGAIAVGAFAIGRLSVGGLSVRRARFRRVEIDDLVVRRLTVLDDRSPRV